jgi:hypothetical protein
MNGRKLMSGPSVILAFAFASIVVLVATMALPTEPVQEIIEYSNSETRSAGVTVHGYATQGWIQNNNSNLVRVKQVWIFNGETTQWIKELKPGEKIDEYIDPQHGFYVLTKEGGEIGWIKPEKNGKREPSLHF